MSIVDRILTLQEERNVTNKEIEIGAGLANASVSQWKRGKGKPSLENIIKVATYFQVTTDYLLGLSDIPVLVPSAPVEKSLTDEEQLLLDAFHTATAQGRFHIIQVCMNELEEARKRESANAG